MKNKITRNITLNRGEVIQKEFKNLKVKNKICSMLVTDKRLIIYTFGRELVKGRKVRRQMMNEIDLNSIHRFEYFYEFHNRPLLLRIFGFLLFAAGAFLAYANYSGTAASLYPIIASYTYYVYGGAALIVIIGLVTLFSTDKVLIMHIRSGMEEKTDLIFSADKFNELALRYIAGRIHHK
ncbi:MAG: hypothetical protein WC479_02425 [Candidatus Izemoplasmatales bacterium]|nr:hypothetical protein [Candidatus Izemoplasmatales bacterium]MDD3865550.1 hypothetical protein [Candidatus Izemoplasmatales bacterium]